MATIKKFKTPKSAVLCMTPDRPTEFQITCMNVAITRLRKLGVNVFRDTTEFDPEYPRLLWDRNGQVTQTKAEPREYSGSTDTVVNTIEEFMALFEVPQSVIITGISKDYDAEVFTDRVQVGCQTISAEKFKDIVAAAKEMGMID